MFKNYLIVASKNDPAGVNITTQLSGFRENLAKTLLTKSSIFDFYLIEGDITETKNIDIEKINSYDFIIFASKHRSEKSEKTLSIHPPGIFRCFGLNPESGKVSRTSAIFLKELFIRLKNTAKEHNLDDYKITLEATHHGPVIEKPCIFIEIGSTENEWTDRKAGFVIAKTLKNIIEEFNTNPYNEIVIGIGGPHYCPNFNKLQEKSNYAISHIIPGYSLPLTEEMVKQAIQKTQEEVDLVLLDWKGIKNSDERERIIQILNKNYINWKKI